MASAADVMKKAQKDYGGSVVQKGDDTYEDSPRLPTGIFPFDLASGGGFPMGRVSIVYGPESSNKTNLCLKAIGQGQILYPDKQAVFVDAEGTYTKSWAAQMGVDTSRLVVVTPECAEQAVDMVEAFLYADDVFSVTLDSMAAMTTTNEIESEAGKVAVGGAALLVGKMLRKINISFNRMRNQGLHPPAFMAINQIRNKIGVMFGNPECLHADTLVNFVDGRSIPIRQVVEQKIDAPIWAFNEDTGQFFETRILSHHYNGEAKDGDFRTVTAQGVDTKNGLFSATVTFTHKFLTAKGWTTAGGLKAGDLLLTKYRSVISGTVKDFLAGALCGDATLFKPNAGVSCGLKFQDSINPQYAAWKAKMLSPFFQVKGSGNKFVVSPTYDLGEFGKQFAGCRHPRGLFDNFTWLGMAIWLMDDGHYSRDRYTLSIGRFKNDEETKEYISECFDQLGLTHSWNGKNVVFTAEASKVLAVNCSPYAPECMAYKFPTGLVAGEFSLEHDGVQYVPTYTPVLSVTMASPRKYRQRGLYDLHIEGHHNYLAGNMDNGFVVHNTMPGGFAPKFAASFIVRVYGKNEMDKDIHPSMPSIKHTSCVIQKWKMPIISTSCEFDMQMLPGKGRLPGHVEDWNTISTYLRELDYLGKSETGKGWTLFGEEFKTLEECRTKLYSNPLLLSETKQQLIHELVSHGAVVNPKESA